jgi:hypothetical protein
MRETAPQALRPNATSTFNVNLPVEKNVEVDTGIIANDILGVSAVSGTGQLPLFITRNPPSWPNFTQAGTVNAAHLYPRIGSQPGDTGGGRREAGVADTELTIRWVFVSAPLATIAGTRLRIRDGKVSLRVACKDDGACKGKALLTTRGKKPKTVGSGKLSIAASKSKTIKLKLNSRGRKLARKKSAKLNAVVDLGGGAKVTRKVTLKR